MGIVYRHGIQTTRQKQAQDKSDILADSRAVEYLGMIEVLRFTYSGTNYDFYDEEVPTMKIRYVQPVDVMYYARGYFHYNIYNKEYRIFQVDFYLRLSTTRTKIESLYAATSSYQPDSITMYYDYARDTTLATTVQMRRDDVFREYVFGQHAAAIYMPVIFVETALGTPTIHRKRIGV